MLSDDGDLLDDHRADYPETDAGSAAADFAALPGVDAAVTESDGRPAVAIRIDPDDADLDTVHSTKADHGLDVVNEAWDDDAGHLLRVCRDNPVERSEGWYAASEELADLATEHTPAEVLDYWMTQRAAAMHVTSQQQRWGTHRGVGKQTVSDNVRAVRDDDA